MKNLKDYINESLLINEAKTGLCIVMASQNNIYCLTDITKKEAESYFTDGVTKYIDILKTGTISFSWNDESIYASELPCMPNLSAVKSFELKHIEDQLKNQEGDEEPYIESEIAGFGNDAWEGRIKKVTAKDILNYFIDAIEDSQCDGDSAYGRAVIDAKKGEVILQGHDDITFMTFAEWKSERE